MKFFLVWLFLAQVPEDKLSSDEEEEAEGHDDKEETGQTSGMVLS